MKYTYMYLLAINFLAFFVAGWDKLAAKSQWRRVPEKTLFTLAALGGAAGLWCAMQLFRHKTKHKSFTIGVPLILLAQVLLAVYFTLNK